MPSSGIYRNRSGNLDQPALPSGSSRTSESPLKLNRLHHFFERTADASPSAIAVIATEPVGYAELEARSNRLAQHLKRLGIRPGQRIGLLLERSIHTYVSLLGVLKCGAAYVPLDPSFPPERLAYIAQDASLHLLLTSRSFRETVAGIGCRTLEIDSAGPAIANEAASRLAIADVDDALCYIIYTSGTTGRPKGVAVNQASIVNFLNVCTPIYGFAPTDRVYQGMTLAFDFSVEEIWPTFATGATLVAGPTDHRKLGTGLADFLIERKISVLCCVPTLLATLDRDVPSLKTLLVGGEACPADLVRRWSQPGRRFLNTYGPTETTVTATWGELSPGKIVTIGRPLPTYSVHILDESTQSVPDGEIGEICIGGPGVAVGYRFDLLDLGSPSGEHAGEWLGRAELTAGGTRLFGGGVAGLVVAGAVEAFLP